METTPDSDRIPRGKLWGVLPSFATLLSSRAFVYTEYSWFELKIAKWKRTLSLGHNEEEDAVTAQYVSCLNKMEEEPGPYKLEKTRNLNTNEYPMFLESDDMYQFLTWKWIIKRLQIEEASTSRHGLRGFFLGIIQVLLCFAIGIMGLIQIEESKYVFTLSSGFIFVIGIWSSYFGILGSLTKSEFHIRRFLTGELWVLSLATTYLYMTIDGSIVNDKECNPSTYTYASSSSGCDERWTEIGISSGFCLLMIGNCVCCFCHFKKKIIKNKKKHNIKTQFWAIFVALNIIDGINDMEGIENEIVMLKFFERKLDGKCYCFFFFFFFPPSF